MLPERIVATLRWFDLQQLPLTLLELHLFLLADPDALAASLNDRWELVDFPDQLPKPVHLDTLISSLDNLVIEGVVATWQGFYFLPGKETLVTQRLRMYEHGIQRERLITRYLVWLRYLPFVRGIGVTGSQSLGPQKATSDIDLFVITHRQWLWTARTLVTMGLHMFGVRRHGRFIANRFCLNHYVAGPKTITESRTLYTAMEYLKLRSMFEPGAIAVFQENNIAWISQFFPNAPQYLVSTTQPKAGALQNFFEQLWVTVFGRWLERQLAQLQARRINVEQPNILVRADELSFHPNSKQEVLLQKFFEFQEQDQGEAVELVVKVESRTVVV
jgi:hypothetical protein